MEEAVGRKAVKAAIGDPKPAQKHYLRVHIEGLVAIDHEPGMFELVLDHEPAQLPDMRDLIEALRKEGFDRLVIDSSVDRLCEELQRGQWARYLANRVSPA